LKNKGYALKFLLNKPEVLLIKERFLFGVSAFGIFKMVISKVLTFLSEELVGVGFYFLAFFPFYVSLFTCGLLGILFLESASCHLGS
jgi:hypothetical protein